MSVTAFRLQSLIEFKNVLRGRTDEAKSENMEPIPEQEARRFIDFMTACKEKCTKDSVQQLTAYVLEHMATSAARLNAFAKYYQSMAETVAEHSDGTAHVRIPQLQLGRNRRERLNMLLMANEILVHLPAIGQALLPALKTLVVCEDPDCEFSYYVDDLLELWASEKMLDDDALQSVMAVTSGQAGVNTRTLQDMKNSKKQPANQRLHGDGSGKWFDLPAANWLCVIQRNPNRPMDPGQVRASNIPITTDPDLKAMVASLKEEVEKVGYAWNRVELEATDVDEMGQILRRDEGTGMWRPTENYYGWSQEFCDQVKAGTVQVYRASNVSSTHGQPTVSSTHGQPTVSSTHGQPTVSSTHGQSTFHGQPPVQPSRFSSLGFGRSGSSAAVQSWDNRQMSRSPSSDYSNHYGANSRSQSPRRHSYSQPSQGPSGTYHNDRHHQTASSNSTQFNNGPTQDDPYNAYQGQDQYQIPTSTQPAYGQAQYAPVSQPISYNTAQSGMPLQPGTMAYSQQYQQNLNGAWPPVFPQMAAQNQYASGAPMYGGQMPMNQGNQSWGGPHHQGQQSNYGNNPHGGGYNGYNGYNQNSNGYNQNSNGYHQNNNGYPQNNNGYNGYNQNNQNNGYHRRGRGGGRGW